jgi:hypothetical protein
MCSVLADVSAGNAEASATKWELKHLLPVVHVGSSSTLVSRRAARTVLQAAPPAYPSIALNLRHCVFLI